MTINQDVIHANVRRALGFELRPTDRRDFEVQNMD